MCQVKLVCAFLYAQLEMLDEIAERRKGIYKRYRMLLRPLEVQRLLSLPHIPEDCKSNYHMFYILLPDMETRDAPMAYLKQHGILAVFHFVPLHSSPMGKKFGFVEGDLPITEQLSGRLLRLPFYYEMTEEEQEYIVKCITEGLEKMKGKVKLRAGGTTVSQIRQVVRARV